LFAFKGFHEKHAGKYPGSFNKMAATGGAILAFLTAPIVIKKPILILFLSKTSLIEAGRLLLKGKRSRNALLVIGPDTSGLKWSQSSGGREIFKIYFKDIQMFPDDNLNA